MPLNYQSVAIWRGCETVLMNGTLHRRANIKIFAQITLSWTLLWILVTILYALNLIYVLISMFSWRSMRFYYIHIDSWAQSRVLIRTKVRALVSPAFYKTSNGINVMLAQIIFYGSQKKNTYKTFVQCYTCLLFHLL